MMNEKKEWWFAIVTALAGAHPSACWGNDEEKAYREREEMKLVATEKLQRHMEPAHPCFRTPWWLLMAYAHWWRAREGLDRMESDDYDQAFERGMNFRRYLGAWLWSVGVPQLCMTANDLDSLHECTGVAPLPHPLLPRGHSEFLTDCFTTTKVDCIPAKNLDKATILLAFHDSQAA